MDVESLFRNQWLWTVLLGLVLFLPVRRLIWVLSVRSEERRLKHATDAARRTSLRHRASVTAALVCFVFSVLYVQVMFHNFFGQP